jgi:hypothetical protein
MTSGIAKLKKRIDMLCSVNAEKLEALRLVHAVLQGELNDAPVSDNEFTLVADRVAAILKADHDRLVSEGKIDG